MEDMNDDDIKAKLPDLFRNFQEITPQPRTMENIIPDFKSLNFYLPGTKASVACTRAGEARDISQEKNATEKDHSFLFADARFGGTDKTHNSNSNKQQKDGNKIKEEKMEMEILQTTRTRMIIMMTKKVEMKTLQMLIDIRCQETDLSTTNC